MTANSAEWTEVVATARTPAHLRDDLQTFLGYWQGLKHQMGRLPRKSEFDPLDVARLWRGIGIIEIVRQPGMDDRYRYRFLGTGHDHVNGASHSGRFMDDVLPEAEMSALRPVLVKVVNDAQPHYWFRRARASGRELTGYERVLTPFLGTGETIDFLIGYWVWHWQPGRPPGLRLVADQGRTIPPRQGESSLL
ncbi:MAG: PAS domain-containing protein [Minwuia sp.]|nr:PAS domain-containing protein [Minwuia sp.]